MLKLYTIYRYKNKINGKSYIGLTSGSLDKREELHLSESRRNKDIHLMFHQALIKYGIEGFDREVLIENIEGIENANKMEIYFIKKFNSYSKGYNMTKGGGGRDSYEFSEESREKMSIAKKGTTLCDSHRNNISKSLSGKNKSEEHVNKISESLSGGKRTPEQRKRMSDSRIGRFTGSSNPAALRVNIFDSCGNIKFRCNGDFDSVCEINGLPKTALRRSYYNNGRPIYGKTTKKSILVTNPKFIGWYAIKS